MGEDLVQQVATYVKNGKHAAILLSAEPTLDAVCSALALQATITSQGGEASVFSAASSLPALQFFKAIPPITPSLGNGQEFAVKISNANAQPGELRYEMVADGVVIYLKPKQGEFQPGDVSVLPKAAQFDVLFVLGAASLEQLGGLYTSNPTAFFGTPIINIDVNPANEYYGAVNWVNVTAASIAENLVDLVALFPDAARQDIVATGLLAGIIEQTHSFRDPKTNPATLSKAAKLIETGARQQDIVQYLFKTRPFGLLQLWGRALARLVAVPEKSLLYSGLTKSDIEKTGTDAGSLVVVVRDLVEMVSDFSVIVVVAETAAGAEVVIAGLPHLHVEDLARKLGAATATAYRLVGKFEYVHFTLSGMLLADVQNQVLQAVPTL